MEDEEETINMGKDAETTKETKDCNVNAMTLGEMEEVLDAGE